MLRRTSAVAVAAAVVGGWLGQAPVPASAEPAPPSPASTPDAAARHPDTTAAPAVYPRPQSMRRRGDFARVTRAVTLVADRDADPYALDVVERALRAAGAREVTRASAPGPGLTVFAGAPAEPRLAALKAEPVGDLPAGGYRLAVSGSTIALAGLRRRRPVPRGPDAPPTRHHPRRPPRFRARRRPRLAGRPGPRVDRGLLRRAVDAAAAPRPAGLHGAHQAEPLPVRTGRRPLPPGALAQPLPGRRAGGLPGARRARRRRPRDARLGARARPEPVLLLTPTTCARCNASWTPCGRSECGRSSCSSPT